MSVQYKEVSNTAELIDAIRLRVDVFINEQHGKPGWEPDEEDKVAKHLIALDRGVVVGTLRFREYPKNQIKIERLAVQKEFRNKGVGKGLLTFSINLAKKRKPTRIWAQVQDYAKDFYVKNGFSVVSDQYDLYGIIHVDMEIKNNE